MKMRFTHYVAGASVALTMALAAPVQAEEKPGMVMHIQSLDALIAEVTKFGTEWELPVNADMLLQGLGGMLHIPNLEGVDRSKPIQLQFGLGDDIDAFLESGETPTVRLMLPLADKAAFEKVAGSDLEAKGVKKGVAFFKNAYTDETMAIRMEDDVAWIGEKRKHVAANVTAAPLASPAFARMPGAWSIYIDVAVLRSAMGAAMEQQKKSFQEMEEQMKQFHEENPDMDLGSADFGQMQSMMDSQQKMMDMMLEQADHLLVGASLSGAPAFHMFLHASEGSEMAKAVALAPTASELLRSFPTTNPVLTSFGNMDGAKGFYAGYIDMYGDMMEGLTEALGEEGKAITDSYNKIMNKAKELYQGEYASFLLQPTESYALNSISFSESDDPAATIALVESMISDYISMIKATMNMDNSPSSAEAAAFLEEGGFDLTFAGTDSYNGVDIRTWKMKLELPEDSSPQNSEKLQEFIDSIELHLAATDGYVVSGIGDPAHMQAGIDHLKSGGKSAPVIADTFGPLSNYGAINLGAAMTMAQSIMDTFLDGEQLPIPPMEGSFEWLTASADGGTWATLRLNEELVASLKGLVGMMMQPPPQPSQGYPAPGQLQNLDDLDSF